CIRIFARMQEGLSVEGSVFRHKQKDQSIHDAQELSVKVGNGYLSSPQAFAKRRVFRMAGEALSEDLERLLDATAQFSQGTRALLFGEIGPPLEPTALWIVTLL